MSDHHEGEWSEPTRMRFFTKPAICSNGCVTPCRIVSEDHTPREGAEIVTMVETDGDARHTRTLFIEAERGRLSASPTEPLPSSEGNYPAPSPCICPLRSLLEAPQPSETAA